MREEEAERKIRTRFFSAKIASVFRSAKEVSGGVCLFFFCLDSIALCSLFPSRKRQARSARQHRQKKTNTQRDLRSDARFKHLIET